MDHAESVLSAPSAVAASEAFHVAVATLGTSYLQTRLYRRPTARLTADTHFAAGGFVARFARADWPNSAGFDYICFDCNPLLAAIRESRTCYRFSDFAPHADPAFGTYWEVFGEANIGEALCATSYGAGGRIASLHLGFPHAAIPPDDARAIQLAGLVLTERLLDFVDDAGPSDAIPLTDRERDALVLVADGKTDWEISVIFGVSESTARFHVDNGRKKLGAVNRAQAVANLINRRLI